MCLYIYINVCVCVALYTRDGLGYKVGDSESATGLERAPPVCVQLKVSLDASSLNRWLTPFPYRSLPVTDPIKKIYTGSTSTCAFGGTPARSFLSKKALLIGAKFTIAEYFLCWQHKKQRFCVCFLKPPVIFFWKFLCGSKFAWE